MEKELVSQADESCPPADQQGEKTELKKESSHHSSRRRSSPSTRHRNYRKRSVSESPEKAPERRSPEISPSSRKRSRNSDYRDDRRHRRRSRSHSRSRSPRRRRRSPSPRNSTNQRDTGQHFDEFGRDLRPQMQTDSVEEKDKPVNNKGEEGQSPIRRKGFSDGDTRDKNSPEKDSPSPKRRDSVERRSKSPDRRRRRSRSRDRGDSRSPERRRRKDFRRSPIRDSRDRRASGEYSSNRRRDRDSDRDRGRSRDNRGRDWDRERRYDRGHDRTRNRENERDRQEDKASSPNNDKPVFVKASSTGLETLPRPARALTSEEVQAKLAAHAESLRKQAQEAASVLNMPSYINPSVVNPHQYAVIQQKRKLLWSGKKTEGGETSGSSSSTVQSTLWNSTTFNNDQGGEMQAKFRRLMGIKGEGTAEPEQDASKPQNEQLMANLEREFERSRAFQLSRGAGGKSGIGLGYSGT